MLKRISIAAALLAASAAPAFAHLDPAEHGSFMAGVSHPLFGADHILAMVAVGLWAALLAQGADHRIPNRRALWLVPAAFVGTIALGFTAALLAVPLPFVEPVILASVVVIGLLAAVALNVPTAIAMVMVGFFAFFHGHAHGGELGSAGALTFGIGFALSTAALHLAGIGLGLGLGSMFGDGIGRFATRIAGGATALGGLWLALGA
ncbi:HupE/UreJ family protein [Mesorhizobium sp. KR9-304]|uniref:HupE/UreJ family protein n=1 Tax=Mesorhizobium sp. KR9-304 TaxID=3156614 RepID=UPI0032B4122E